MKPSFESYQQAMQSRCKDRFSHPTLVFFYEVFGDARATPWQRYREMPADYVCSMDEQAIRFRDVPYVLIQKRSRA